MKAGQELLILGFAVLAVTISCNLPTTEFGDGVNLAPQDPFPTPVTPSPFDFLPSQRAPGDPILTPTPNPLRDLPDIRTETIPYSVKANDTLGNIANTYGITVDSLAAANDIQDVNILSVGQALVIPPPVPGAPAPDFKLIPDSELVNGPYNALFDLHQYVQDQGGHLAAYREEVDGQELTGSQIIEKVARNYSVNPRLLLAVLEHQSGWVTEPQARLDSLSFPMGHADPNRSGLYLQLTWAANNLNYGYYLWRVNGLGHFRTADGIFIPASPQINAGTAGVQHLFAQLLDETAWRRVVTEGGFIQTFTGLFGYPFDWAIEPILPPDLSQPVLQLPFEPGVAWTFTGGPHGGWGGGSAWGALDFAPPKEELGCSSSDEWVVAMSDGLIVYSEDGIVIQDLDGDGKEQTGWTLLYLHIETRQRVPAGTFLKAGERVGHPSCEGGFSTGTHVHIARRYNGEWIPTNGTAPFVLDGWVAYDNGILYGGYLEKGNRVVKPCQCQDPENKLQR